MNANMHVLTYFITLVATVILTGVSAWITKCVERKQHKVILNCPADHVIYQPTVHMGSSTSGTCRQEDGDCIGLPQEVKNLKESCFWKSWCKLSWTNSLTLTSSANTSCHNAKPTYIVYDNPTCIPSDNIVDIQSKEDIPSSRNRGVIRSSRHYPHNYNDIKTSQRKMLNARPGYDLVLFVDDVSTSGQDNVMIRATSPHENTKTLLYEREASDLNFQVAEKDIEIVFNVGSRTHSAGGFIIRFEYRKRETSNTVTVKDHVTDGVINPKSSPHFNVKGSLDTCIARKDTMNLVCPTDHVIFRPDVTSGVSNGGTCMAKPGDCQGLTHTLITQINRCYWKNHCGLSWSRGVPLTMTRTLNCLAQYPSYISVKSYECIHKTDVFDICDRSYKYINSTEGIIRSHANYPWHYPTRGMTCRKYISINSDHGLRIYTEKIDLDPDTKGDNLRFDADSLKKQVKKIGGQRADMTLTGGCLMLTFKISKRSKGGEGFILKFEPARKHDERPVKTTDMNCEMFRKKAKTKNYLADVDRKGKPSKNTCRDKGRVRRKCVKGRGMRRNVGRRGRKRKKETALGKILTEDEGSTAKKDIQNTEGRRGKKKRRKKNRRGRKRGKGKGRRKWRKRGRKDKRRRRKYKTRSLKPGDISVMLNRR